ncbi:MAG: hypothetical protein ABIN01_18220 [Ferruginibacter sp.]
MWRIEIGMEIEPKVSMPDYLVKSIKGGYQDFTIIIDPELPGTIAPTGVVHYAKDLNTHLVKDNY